MFWENAPHFPVASQTPGPCGLMLWPQCEKSGLWVSSVPYPQPPQAEEDSVGSREINGSTRRALGSCFFLSQLMSLGSGPFIFSPARNLRVLWSLLPAWEKECPFSLRGAGRLTPGCFCPLLLYLTTFNAELCCRSILSVLVHTVTSVIRCEEKTADSLFLAHEPAETKRLRQLAEVSAQVTSGPQELLL